MDSVRRWRARLLLIGTGVAFPGAEAHAQARALTLAQFAHRAWTARDGAPGAVNALAQTPDGYLWLGTGAGLYRFDGVHFEPFAPPPGQVMPSRVIGVLRALPDGSLWIGYSSGGASVLAGGRLVSYGPEEGLPPVTVNALARDSTGTMWAATMEGIARLADGRWHRVGPECGYPGGATADLLVDRRGTVWAAEFTGVYALPRGARRFVRRAPSLATGVGDAGNGSLREDPDGSVWGASVALGPVPLSDSVGGPPPPGARRYAGPGWKNLVIDRRGHAWRLSHTGVLMRVPLQTPSGERALDAAAGGRDTLVFSRAAGMSGAVIQNGLEDREGNIWVGTEGGLDQFRATKLTPAVSPRLTVDPVVAANDRGGVWAGSASGGPLMTIGAGGAFTEHPQVSGRITALAHDPGGGVWVGLGTPAAVWYGGGGRFARVPLPPEANGMRVQALARDREGAVWLSVLYGGVFRRRGSTWERFVPRPDLGGKANAQTIFADRAGRTWLGYKRNVLAAVAGDSVRVFSAADGLRVGTVTAIHARGDTVWVGGDEGVMYLTHGARESHLAPLAVASGALHSVTGIVTSADGALWLNSDEGVIRLPAAEIRRALRDPAYRAHDERFGLPDGLEGAAVHIRPLGTAVAGTDGRLWFTTQTSVAWVDPQSIPRNTLTPAVHIGGLNAGDRVYAATGPVTLPQRTTALSVAYTATSLAVPERVRFRYRLIGLDTTWQDAGARREAFYTNLGPGPYRFQVVAANDDGVWNTTGASLDFVVPPTFVQTNAFRALCAAAAGVAVWGLAVWRQRRAVAATRARSEAAFAERMRVARELHDTLLTDVAGIRMQLDAATRAAGASGVAAAVVAAIRDQAGHALVNARRAVVDMRAPGDGGRPVSEQVAESARRTFAGTDVDARVEHTGHVRRYAPAVEAEALRIAGEALANARTHARCRTVRVACGYGRRELRLEVRDDGRGFDPTRAAPNGHFGLVGLRERAGALGARLTVESAPGRGTAVRVVIPTDGAD